jgi:hypothetical protein
VAAFFFVFNELSSFIFVLIVALALQHIENTDIFNAGDPQTVILPGGLVNRHFRHMCGYDPFSSGCGCEETDSKLQRMLEGLDSARCRHRFCGFIQCICLCGRPSRRHSTRPVSQPGLHRFRRPRPLFPMSHIPWLQRTVPMVQGPYTRCSVDG